MTPESSEPPSLLELLERPAWMRQSACREMDVSMFVTERGQCTEPGNVICAGCSVRAECAAYAIAVGQDLHGVWRGMAARERRGIRQWSTVA